MTEADLIQRYFAAFNAGDADGMAALVADDVQHYPNQGELRTGKDAFRAFLAEMDRAYREEARDLAIFTGPTGRVAAEFVIHGTYLEAQSGLPEANGQVYVLPVGSFFEVAGDRITRVTTYYNLDDWLRQVGG
ncbi:ketosteroid isomerase-related protein [Palleronia sp.]|uniref:ketosteroid isomerase-related protein n=1 Tax=Palleronia sp. TaxID=1940284 RepID=UPI0035C8153D